MRAAKDRSYRGLDCDNTRGSDPCDIGKQPRRTSPFSLRGRACFQPAELSRECGSPRPLSLSLSSCTGCARIIAVSLICEFVIKNVLAVQQHKTIKIKKKHFFYIYTF